MDLIFTGRVVGTVPGKVIKKSQAMHPKITSYFETFSCCF